MFRRFGRTLVPAVLVVAALVAAGCGSSSNRSAAYSSSTSASSGQSGQTGQTGSGGSSGSALSANDDGKQVDAALQPLKQASNAVKANPNDASAWNQVASASKQASSAIGGLTPPSSMQSSQQALTAAVGALADPATKVANDLNNSDSASALTDKGDYAKAALALGSATITWAQAAKAAGAQ